MNLTKYKNLNEYVTNLTKTFEEHGVKLETIFEPEQIDEEMENFMYEDMAPGIWDPWNNILNGTFIFCKVDKPIKINETKNINETKEIPVYHFFLSLGCPKEFSERTLFEGVNKEHIMTWSTGQNEQTFTNDFEWLKDVKLPEYGVEVYIDIKRLFQNESEQLHNLKDNKRFKDDRYKYVCVNRLINNYAEQERIKKEIAQEVKNGLPKEKIENFDFEDFIIKKVNNVSKSRFYDHHDGGSSEKYTCIAIEDKNNNEISFIKSEKFDDEYVIEVGGTQIISIEDFKNKLLKSNVYKCNINKLQDEPYGREKVTFVGTENAKVHSISKIVTGNSYYKSILYDKRMREKNVHFASSWDDKIDEKMVMSKLKESDAFKNEFNFNNFKMISTRTLFDQDYDVEDNGRNSVKTTVTVLLIDESNNRICFDLNTEYKFWTDFNTRNYDEYYSFEFNIKNPHSEIITDILNEKADRIIDKTEEILQEHDIPTYHGYNR